MAYAAPKYPTDTKEHRASRATARANKPWPRSTKRAARSVQSNAISNHVAVPVGLACQVLKRHGIHLVSPKGHVNPANFLTMAAPCFNPCCHLSRCGREVPAPRKSPNIKRGELVCCCPRRTPPPPR
jgi:hypothetical protein